MPEASATRSDAAATTSASATTSATLATPANHATFKAAPVYAVDDVPLDKKAASRAIGELRAEMRALGYEAKLLHQTLDARCSRTAPHDLLVATLENRRKGTRRAVGLLRRAMRFDAARGAAYLQIELVFVSKPLRGRGVGRALLSAAIVYGPKPKDVRLTVAGSESNERAVGLYASMGFEWTDGSHTEMFLAAERVADALSAGVRRVGSDSDLSSAPTEHASEGLRRLPRSPDEMVSTGVDRVAECSPRTISGRPRRDALVVSEELVESCALSV